jgi:hypothetical protein
VSRSRIEAHVGAAAGEVLPALVVADVGLAVEEAALLIAAAPIHLGALVAADEAAAVADEQPRAREDPGRARFVAEQRGSVRHAPLFVARHVGRQRSETDSEPAMRCCQDARARGPR